MVGAGGGGGGGGAVSVFGIGDCNFQILVKSEIENGFNLRHELHLNLIFLLLLKKWPRGS